MLWFIYIKPIENMLKTDLVRMTANYVSDEIYDVRKHLQANVDGGQCGVC